MSTEVIKPVTAVAKGITINPRKVRPVVALVRGRTVADALVILEHTPRRSAPEVAKLVKSAAANAKHNHGFKEDSLYIQEIFVTFGPRLKRYRPAARGGANKFQKKSSHVHIRVNGDKKPAKKPAAKKTNAKEKK